MSPVFFAPPEHVLATARKRQPPRGRARRLCLLLSAVLLLLLAHSSPAAELPDGFAETLVAGGLAAPTAMEFAPDGRLFVCQQGGQLRVIKDGALLPTPFVTVAVDPQGERGLLGVTFDPDFADNGYVYVYYTATTPAVHNRVSRFVADGDVAQEGSEEILLELDDLSGATNHNGGAMHFGPDGKLYVAVGENAYAPNAQTLDNLLGKMLRLNPDGSIPEDNPFYDTASGVNRAIWALGLRNPFTFAFQPGTGRLFINDVGHYGPSQREEINDGGAGANYGWPGTEGYTDDPRFNSPVYAYDPNEEGGCAITGGTFYDPPADQFPDEYRGSYFFADFCGGWIRRIDPANGSLLGTFATGVAEPVDLKVDAEGSLYYLARGAGQVYRIQFTDSQAPGITWHPSDQTVTLGLSATFSVGAGGTPPLAYQWQRDGEDIPGATAPSYTTPPVTMDDNGARFRCVVSNATGSVTSDEATLTATANVAPTAVITAPEEGALYAAGDTIEYAGAGADPEDGDLPDSAFTWQVDFHHSDHVHPFLPAASGSRGGSFTIPTSGETEADVWYRIYLTVTDSEGMSHTTYRDVSPRTSTVTVETSPPGLQITYDCQPQTAPFSAVSVVGMTRTLGVLSPQTVDGVTYDFAGWSDEGGATHDITTPEGDATYTAVFTPRTNEAAFVSQSVPATMTAGQSYEVSVTLRNDGGNTWTEAEAYSLGAQNPQDNVTWGLNRVQMPGEVAPGEEVTFGFPVTAPPTPGTYDFQWRMVQEYVQWFGDYTPGASVEVSAAPD